MEMIDTDGKVCFVFVDVDEHFVRVVRPYDEPSKLFMTMYNTVWFRDNQLLDTMHLLGTVGIHGEYPDMENMRKFLRMDIPGTFSDPEVPCSVR